MAWPPWEPMGNLEAISGPGLGSWTAGARRYLTFGPMRHRQRFACSRRRHGRQIRSDRMGCLRPVRCAFPTGRQTDGRLDSCRFFERRRVSSPQSVLPPGDRIPNPCYKSLLPGCCLFHPQVVSPCLALVQGSTTRQVLNLGHQRRRWSMTFQTRDPPPVSEAF